jgi:hypothetical protein
MVKKKRVLKTETLIRNTNKRFPGCRAVTDEYGLWYIMDMHGSDTFEEFMIPHTDSERKAWEYGKLTAQTIQNFNRAHPLRDSDGGFSKLKEDDGEFKNARISKRKRNSTKI